MEGAAGGEKTAGRLADCDVGLLKCDTHNSGRHLFSLFSFGLLIFFSFFCLFLTQQPRFIDTLKTTLSSLSDDDARSPLGSVSDVW